MAAVGPTWGVLLVSLMAGGFFGLPLSVPPLPPDPIIERSLPDECLAAFQFAGRAKPDASSKNETEKLMAEEEVQIFIDQVGVEIAKALKQKAEGDPLAEAVSAELPGLLRTLGTRPLAIYLASFSMAESGPDLRGGLIANLGKESAATEAALKKLQLVLLQHAPEQPTTVTVGGVAFTRLPTPPGAPEVMWGVKQSYLYVTIGKESAKELTARAAKADRKPPVWFSGLKKRLPVEKASTVSYINTAGILKIAQPFMSDPQQQAMVSALGIDKLKFIGSVTGLTATGMSGNTWLALDGEPSGIFALAATKGISKDDLQLIPADVMMAYVAKLDLADLYTRVLDGIEKVEPNARGAMEDQVTQATSMIGMKLQEDLLQPLGDTWSVFSSPGSAIGLPTGLAITASVRDREKLASTHEKLLQMGRGLLAQATEGKVSIKESDYKGTHIYYVQGTGAAAIPLTPTWCLTKDRLIVTLFPQMMKTLLARKAGDKCLADNPAVQKRLAGDAASLVTYQNTPAMIGSTFGMVQVVAPMAQGQLAEAGFDVTIPALPNLESIQPHVQPVVTTLRRSSDGLVLNRTYTLPITVSVDPATAGIATALLLPAVQAAREAARRNQSMNNLKQCMLAMHNYHDVNQGFPAAAICNKEGKPLLSWRVAILPYIEEANLYEQFHLDEPWDSEHNKKLIPLMPAVYKNPSLPNKEDGKTVYVVPTGKAALFKESAKKVTFAEITDGTSNTIAVVEAAPESAVIWTKPDDLAIDPKQPLKGLKGARPKGFLAGFADGSVRFIDENVDKQALPAMFTRDGGDLVTAP